MIMRTYDPNRREYNKRIKTQKHCEFCEADIIRRQSCPSLEGKHWHALAAIYPYLNGNMMIVSRRHIDRLEKISPEEWSDLHETIVRVQARLGELFGTKDFNVGINIGKESGASIKHLHWQVIPRKKGQRQTVLNVLGDLHLISVSGDDLKKMIEGKRK